MFHKRVAKSLSAALNEPHSLKREDGLISVWSVDFEIGLLYRRSVILRSVRVRFVHSILISTLNGFWSSVILANSLPKSSHTSFVCVHRMSPLTKSLMHVRATLWIQSDCQLAIVARPRAPDRPVTNWQLADLFTKESLANQSLHRVARSQSGQLVRLLVELLVWGRKKISCSIKRLIKRRKSLVWSYQFHLFALRQASWWFVNWWSIIFIKIKKVFFYQKRFCCRFRHPGASQAFGGPDSPECVGFFLAASLSSRPLCLSDSGNNAIALQQFVSINNTAGFRTFSGHFLFINSNLIMILIIYNSGYKRGEMMPIWRHLEPSSHGAP